MTLQECIKQEKPFRRIAWTHGDWVVVENREGYGGGELYYLLGEYAAELHFVDDLLATDWIIEDENS